MGTVKKFEDLEVWQLARKLSIAIYIISMKEPFKSNFQFRDQIQRSSGSVMDNIAEGYGRGGNKELISFLSIAKGSCSETRSQLYRAYDYGYLRQEQLEELLNQTQLILAKLQSFINHLKKTEHRGPKFK
ncbi:MAG: four helix bundle protein [Balneolaceae bacterium]|nr:MAG: four helix bundle protein [Balneolaceae bacterium]